MGLADLMGIADLYFRKVESTIWLKHKLKATLGGQFEQTDGRSGFSFPLRFARGTAGICHAGLWGFSEAL